MSEGLLIDIMELTIQTTALMCAPLILTILIVSVVIQVFQSVTQLKDQSIAFVPKFFITGIVFIIAIPWYIQITRQYCEIIFKLMESASQ